MSQKYKKMSNIPTISTLEDENLMYPVSCKNLSFTLCEYSLFTRKYIQVKPSKKTLKSYQLAGMQQSCLCLYFKSCGDDNVL